MKTVEQCTSGPKGFAPTANHRDVLLDRKYGITDQNDAQQCAGKIREEVMKEFRERIVVDPEICHGKPTIKGTRVRVANILGGFACGETMEETLDDFSRITKEDIFAAFRYAAEVVDTAKLPPQQLPKQDLDDLLR